MREFVTMRVISLPEDAEGVLNAIAQAAVYVHQRGLKARVAVLHVNDFAAVERHLPADGNATLEDVNYLRGEKTERAIKVHTTAGTLILVQCSAGGRDIGLPPGVALLGREVWA